MWSMYLVENVMGNVTRVSIYGHFGDISCDVFHVVGSVVVLNITEVEFKWGW